MVITINCPCGRKVTGVSEVHAKANLKEHKKSKRHREFMEYQKSQEGAK